MDYTIIKDLIGPNGEFLGYFGQNTESAGSITTPLGSHRKKIYPEWQGGITRCRIPLLQGKDLPQEPVHKATHAFRRDAILEFSQDSLESITQPAMEL